MGRVVVVTGGTAGVGRAVARAFAEQGDAVAVLARGRDGLAATEAELRSTAGRGEGIACDVADAAQVDEAAAEVERRLGPVDVWVNNAMVGVFAPFQDVTPEEYDRVTAVVYGGSVNGTRAALRSMVPRDRGVVVQVGSALAYRGIPLQSAYCGAKHAIVGYLDSVRTELRHDGSRVRISQVHLPAVNTPQFAVVRNKMGRHGMPVPPIYQPEVPARAVVHAASHPRREYWLGASTVATILGNRVAPWLLDRYLARNGYDSQLDESLPPPEPGEDYLFAPRPGDHGAHGAFDEQALAHSPQWPLSQHRALSTGAGVLALAAIARRVAR